MKILCAFLFFMTITRSAYAQTELEFGGSFWQGSSNHGLGAWIAVANNSNRASFRLDRFGIAQACSSCGDGDGLLLFLMLGRDVTMLDFLQARIDVGPGFLRLGEESGFGSRVSGSLQLRVWKIGIGAEAFLARSLGGERIRPAGLGIAGSVRL